MKRRCREEKKWAEPNVSLPSPQQRLGRVDGTVLDHAIDIGGPTNIVNRIGIKNDEVGELALLDPADSSADLAAKKLSRIRSCALQYLHRRQASFFHQLKFAKQ